MPFLAFKHSSLNFAFAYVSFVFPAGHAERSALIGDDRIALQQFFISL